MDEISLEVFVTLSITYFTLPISINYVVQADVYSTKIHCCENKHFNINIYVEAHTINSQIFPENELFSDNMSIYFISYHKSLLLLPAGRTVCWTRRHHRCRCCWRLPHAQGNRQLTHDPKALIDTMALQHTKQSSNGLDIQMIMWTTEQTEANRVVYDGRVVVADTMSGLDCLFGSMPEHVLCQAHC